MDEEKLPKNEVSSFEFLGKSRQPMIVNNYSNFGGQFNDEGANTLEKESSETNKSDPLGKD
jgi:hypothetical protein